MGSETGSACRGAVPGSNGVSASARWPRYHASPRAADAGRSGRWRRDGRSVPMTLEGWLDAAAAPNDPYAFAGDRVAEQRRLIEQSRLFAPFTEECLREAGLGSGMHVVDLGSGAGDTAILAARLVGPNGSARRLARPPPQARP